MYFYSCFYCGDGREFRTNRPLSLASLTANDKSNSFFFNLKNN